MPPKLQQAYYIPNNNTIIQISLNTNIKTEINIFLNVKAGLDTRSFDTLLEVG